MAGLPRPRLAERRGHRPVDRPDDSRRADLARHRARRRTGASTSSPAQPARPRSAPRSSPGWRDVALELGPRVPHLRERRLLVRPRAWRAGPGGWRARCWARSSCALRSAIVVRSPVTRFTVWRAPLRRSRTLAARWVSCCWIASGSRSGARSSKPCAFRITRHSVGLAGLVDRDEALRKRVERTMQARLERSAGAACRGRARP